MEMADKLNRYEIAVDKDMVAFIEVPSNLKQLFMMVYPRPFFGCCPCLPETWPLFT
jgi:hypothetical protein